MRFQTSWRPPRLGRLGPIIELDEWILVVHVTAIQPEGIRPLEEVYSAAQQQAELQAKRAFQMAKMQQAYSAGGFDGLSMQLGLPAQTASVGFEQAIVSGMGRDLQFAGVALSLSPGTDSRRNRRTKWGLCRENYRD